jgi:hypothetical protein
MQTNILTTKVENNQQIFKPFQSIGNSFLEIHTHQLISLDYLDANGGTAMTVRGRSFKPIPLDPLQISSSSHSLHLPKDNNTHNSRFREYDEEEVLVGYVHLDSIPTAHTTYGFDV